MSHQTKWTTERISQVVENVNLRRDMISEFERSQTVKLVQQIRNDMQAEIDALRKWGQEAYTAIELANSVMPPLELKEWNDLCGAEGVRRFLLSDSPVTVWPGVDGEQDE